MKRILALVLAGIMVLSLVACGDEEKAEKYCSSCGGGISKDVAFCEHCGAELGTTKEENKADDTSSTGQTQSSVTSKPTETTKPVETSKPTTTSKPSQTAHKHSYASKVTAATCTARGYTTHTCSCGETYTDTYVEPKHSYEKYKCKQCGTVDKTHATEYLLEWLKKNGKADGEYVSINKYLNNYETQLSITYNYSGNYMYVSVLSDGESNTDSDDSYVQVFLLKGTQNYDYYSIYGYMPSGCEAIGSIDRKNYTTNSPIGCDAYNGNKDERIWFMDHTRLAINLALTFLDDYINQTIPEITIADLGFESF